MKYIFKVLKKASENLEFIIQAIIINIWKKISIFLDV